MMTSPTGEYFLVRTDEIAEVLAKQVIGLGQSFRLEPDEPGYEGNMVPFESDSLWRLTPEVVVA